MVKKNIIKGIVVGASVILVSGSIAVCGICIGSVSGKISAMDNNIEAMNNNIKKYMDITDDIAAEDDIVIAESYKILSTKKISDAYINKDVNNLSETEKETMELAKNIINEVIKDDMTDYDKEKAIYDWMCANIQTDESGTVVVRTAEDSVSEPLGVLKNKKAVCVGYATTFRMFMQMLEIDCKVVHNTSMYHSWNEVKLDDGWYHVDIYNDTKTGNYQNFNLDDTQCLDGHEWNREYFPAAAGKKYNYALMNSEKIADVYDIIPALRKSIENKKYSLVYNLGKDLSDDKKAIVEKIFSSVQEYISGDYGCVSRWVENDEGESIYCMYLEPYSDTYIEIADEEVEKINSKVMEIFGDYTSQGSMVDYDVDTNNNYHIKTFR